MNRRNEFFALFGVSAVLHIGCAIGIGLVMYRVGQIASAPVLVEGGASVLVTLEVPFVKEPGVAPVPPAQPSPASPPATVASELPAAEPVAIVAVEPAPQEPLAQEPAVLDTALSLPPLPAPELARSPGPAPEVDGGAVAAAEPPSTPPPSAGSGANDRRASGVQGAENFETDLRPAYPPGARLRNEEGAVRALVELTSAGRAKEVTLEASSGFASLDKVALDAIRKAHFRAKSGAVKEGALMRLSIRFKLADEALRP